MIFTELLSVLSVGQSHKYHTYLMPQLTRRLLWGNSPNECLFNFFPPLFTFNTVIKCHCLSGSFGGYFFLFYNSERAFYCLAHQAVRDDWKSSLWSISLTEVWPFSITNLNLLHWELKSWEMSAAMQLQVLCTLSPLHSWHLEEWEFMQKIAFFMLPSHRVAVTCMQILLPQNIPVTDSEHIRNGLK